MAKASRQTANWTHVTAAAAVRDAVMPLARVLRQQAVGRYGPTEISVLGAIRRGEPIRLTDVAVAENLSLPTVSKATSLLEADGLVERVQDPSDGRVSRARLTRSGRRWVSDAEERINEWLVDQLAMLDDAELNMLAAALPVLRRVGATPR